MQIDVWSDIACPWCYVGKRRLEAALEFFAGADDVELRWHAFELDPDAPAAHEGTYAERIARKYGRTPEESAALLDSMSEMAAPEGLELRFEQIRGGNTASTPCPSSSSTGAWRFGARSTPPRCWARSSRQRPRRPDARDRRSTTLAPWRT
ncbi:MAG TPA: DsbA family protein [Solirubrobacteraceae bacterium]|nr:DsbA family protein [Solirubrobacteraceae bacterium]